MTKKRVHILASGRVQGVYYRQFALKNAAELGVTGWVKNLRNGKVEAVAEGDSEAVDKFIAWCKKGPASARVDHLEVQEEEYKDEFENFRVTH